MAAIPSFFSSDYYKSESTLITTSVITRALKIPFFSYPSVKIAIGAQVLALGLPKLVSKYLEFSQRNKPEPKYRSLFSKINPESCLSYKDFAIRNVWKLSNEGISSDRGPGYIVDKSTNKIYLNESPNIIRFKCLGLALVTTDVHSLTFVYKTLRLVSGYFFWSRKKKGFVDFATRKVVHSNWQTRYDFKERLGLSLKEFSSIISMPLSIVGLQLSAIYGIFKPYDGRKLYASIEKMIYGRSFIAPCFQPNPRHFYGGDMPKTDIWKRLFSVLFSV